jgi:hypothetical protein
MLLAFTPMDGVPAIAMPGWTALAQVNQSTSQLSGRVFYRTATGSDPVALDTDASEAGAWIIWRIVGPTGGVPGAPSWTTADDASATPDSPSHTPAGGAAKYLWISAVGIDGSVTGVGLSAAPASYSNVIIVPESTGAGTKAWSASRYAEASSENPGAWTTSDSDQWIAGTIAIPPS